MWFVLAAVATYLIAYRFYARLIEYKVLKPRDERATPAEEFENGKDFMPTDRRVLFGHHFAAIAGAGPLVGPVLAAQMGYLPGTLWIILGVIVAGGVQDYLVLFFSMRRNGRSLGQMTRDELGRTGGIIAINLRDVDGIDGTRPQHAAGAHEDAADDPGGGHPVDGRQSIQGRLASAAHQEGQRDQQPDPCRPRGEGGRRSHTRPSSPFRRRRASAARFPTAAAG